MDEHLKRRLESADPARPTPIALEAVIEDLVTRPRRRWRRRLPVLVAGGAIVLTGALAAATDVNSYLMSVPPFSELADGEVRVVSGLPYEPRSGLDAGEPCKLYIDLAGMTDADFAAVSEYWASADSDTFAARVNGRLNTFSPTEDDELEAVRVQILKDLEQVVPGIDWGTAPPDRPFNAGDPHLATISRICEDGSRGQGAAQ